MPRLRTSSEKPTRNDAQGCVILNGTDVSVLLGDGLAAAYRAGAELEAAEPPVAVEVAHTAAALEHTAAVPHSSRWYTLWHLSRPNGDSRHCVSLAPCLPRRRWQRRLVIVLAS